MVDYLVKCNECVWCVICGSCLIMEGRVGQGRAGQGRVGQGRAGQDRVG